MRRLVALLTVAALAFPGTFASAQSQPQEETQGQQQTSIDPTKLGVSLNRISRELERRAATETSEFAGRKLNVRVEVFGQAPPIDFFSNKEFSLIVGPVPNSAPTHREHIEFVTPEEFKSPAADFMGLAVWAATKLAAKSKKAKCEEEIEIYRRTLMQGIPVTAPRCAQ